jgi:hypothetical protein
MSHTFSCQRAEETRPEHSPFHLDEPLRTITDTAAPRFSARTSLTRTEHRKEWGFRPPSWFRLFLPRAIFLRVPV